MPNCGATIDEKVGIMTTIGFSVMAQTAQVTQTRFVFPQFSAFNTEQNLDQVEIWIGGPTQASATLFTRLSGTTVPSAPIYSTNNFLIVIFTSDNSGTASGFTAAWTAGKLPAMESNGPFCTYRLYLSQCRPVYGLDYSICAYDKTPPIQTCLGVEHLSNYIPWCLGRDHFVYAPSQCETTLQCNVVSYWQCAFTKWSLLIRSLTLTHKSRLTHICVSNLTTIVSDNGLSLNQCKKISNWAQRNKLQWNFNRNSHIFIKKKCIWKGLLQNGGHFVSASICLWRFSPTTIELML